MHNQFFKISSLISILAISALGFLQAQASSSGVIQRSQLEAHSVRSIAQYLESETFVYAGRKKLFGFYSTESCLWTSQNALMIKNYCHDGRVFPARSLVVWTKDFGAIQIYEEDLGEIVKRDLRLNSFSYFLSKLLPGDLNDLNIDKVDALIEEIYYKQEPACWSTNIDLNRNAPVANCYNTDIGEFTDWAVETQAIVNNKQEFENFYDQLLNLIPIKN